jgi:putative SOS response-associated peptidase YedK
MRSSRASTYPPRWNGAPSQEQLIRRNRQTSEVSLDPLRWGLPKIPIAIYSPKLIECLKGKRRLRLLRDLQKEQKACLLVRLAIRLNPHDNSALPLPA